MKLIVFILSLVLSGCTSVIPVAEVAAEPIYSQRDRVHPEYAEHGMVASQEAEATRIGVEILRQGGNAVDAAVAIGFALAVTLPRAGNLGGGGFMVVYSAESKETTALDFREIAPARAHRDMYLDKKGNVDRNRVESSHLAAGVPGTVSGLAETHRRYGKLPWKEVLAPAIRLAAQGMPVNSDHVFTLGKAKERLHRNAEARRIYYKPDGSLYRVGEKLKLLDLARSMQQIAEGGPRAFYEGPIAHRIAEDMKANGGIVTLEDLKEYRPVWRTPVRGSYRGFEIVGMPPPSSGVVHIIQMMNILEGYPMASFGAGSAASIHRITEAMRRAFADRAVHLGDPDYWKVPVPMLISKTYARQLRESIDLDHATDSNTVQAGDPRFHESDETTHFSVMDSDGNVAACTYTLNFSFGSGIVVPGTGIFLNNEMDDFSAKPGSYNAYGLLGGEANAIEAGKRPLSSMSPLIVFKEGKPYLATGSPGGPRLITAVLQVLLNVLDHGMNIAEATFAPRVHHQWKPDVLRVEEGINSDTLDLLRSMGHRTREANSMGSVQTVIRNEQGFGGAADSRRPGALAAGY